MASKAGLCDLCGKEADPEVEVRLLRMYQSSVVPCRASTASCKKQLQHVCPHYSCHHGWASQCAAAMGVFTDLFHYSRSTSSCNHRVLHVCAGMGCCCRNAGRLSVLAHMMKTYTMRDASRSSCVPCQAKTTILLGVQASRALVGWARALSMRKHVHARCDLGSAQAALSTSSCGLACSCYTTAACHPTGSCEHTLCAHAWTSQRHLSLHGVRLCSPPQLLTLS